MSEVYALWPDIKAALIVMRIVVIKWGDWDGATFLRQLWPQAEREPEFLSLSLDWFQPTSSLVFQSEDSNTEHNLKIIPVVKMLQEEASG